MSLEAIIFDVDGTLAETEEVHRAAFNLSFRDAGLTWHWDQALYGRLLQVTGGKERIHHYIDSQRQDEALARTTATIASLHAAKTAHYTHLVERGAMGLRPGFAALLEQARAAGVRLAIATTTSLPNVAALLRTALGERAEGCFEVIAAGDTVAHKKPAPDIYLSALERLRLSASACLAIEDSRHGVRAALAAGIATIAVRSAYTREQDFSGAALVVDALEEVPARLGASDLLAALRVLHDRASNKPGNSSKPSM
ncbi:MAG TPA: HAD-IA family hydrolase [Steroidobacteraceae bacterium]